MQLIPAIDLRGGRCVRLLKGDFGAQTRYDVDPVGLAAEYRGWGAAWLHVVDLDGAASGRPVNLELIAAMRSIEGLKIQMGGGIRDRASLDAALEVADRIVLGSLAVTDPARVAEWLAAYGAERFTLGFDVRFGEDGRPYVTTHGWTQSSALTLADAVMQYRAAGLRHVLCTDVDKDGALGGPNLALYRDCAARWPALAFQASGGVRDAADLAELAATGVAAAISGKALLEGRIRNEEIRRFLPNA
jgi:phosphoribosylformimino-5-aminoimidazole carboxamide ribotide isomerase